jgi:methylated-DNA-[protein]-cysteine S-methyltransferase
MTPETLSVDRVPSPLGTCLLVFDDAANLRALEWEDFETRMLQLLKRHWGNAARGPELVARKAPKALRDALTAYFDGHITALDALAVQTQGTPFQQDIWQALREIPAGRTVSYGQLASRIDRPSAVRAVGLAVGANPVSLVVPCHRVIGADGSLTGYAGGLARKRWLLAHEAAG